jgi:ABC-type Na+ efflux pump permease subunit
LDYIKTRLMFGKLRPQIFLSIVVLGVLSALGVWAGFNEIATGCVGGIIALGMKVLENE